MIKEKNNGSIKAILTPLYFTLLLLLPINLFQIEGRDGGYEYKPLVIEYEIDLVYLPMSGATYSLDNTILSISKKDSSIAIIQGLDSMSFKINNWFEEECGLNKNLFKNGCAAKSILTLEGDRFCYGILANHASNNEVWFLIQNKIGFILYAYRVVLDKQS